MSGSEIDWAVFNCLSNGGTGLGVAVGSATTGVCDASTGDLCCPQRVAGWLESVDDCELPIS